jgi:site-specific DNA-cytosine methylase
LAHYVSDYHCHALDAPLPTITTKHQFAWIRRRRGVLERRMFSGREYARGQSIPDSYVLTGKVTHDVRLAGNAVPPKVMCELVSQVIHG